MCAVADRRLREGGGCGGLHWLLLRCGSSRLFSSNSSSSSSCYWCNNGRKRRCRCRCWGGGWRSAKVPAKLLHQQTILRLLLWRRRRRRHKTIDFVPLASQNERRHFKHINQEGHSALVGVARGDEKRVWDNSLKVMGHDRKPQK